MYKGKICRMLRDQKIPQCNIKQFISASGMLTSQIGETETQTLTINNFFLTVNNTKIFARHLIPKTDSHTILIIVHGFGQHSGLFLNVAQHFLTKQYEVLMVDLKGYGYSGCGRQNTTIQDMEECVVAAIEKADTEKPLVLFGHSMGGLVITSILIDYPFLNISAVMVEAPFLGMPVGREIPWHKKFIIRHFGSNLKTFVLNSMINITAIAKNAHHIRRMVDDTLVYPFLNLPLAQSMMISISKAHEYAHSIKTPYLILHGVKDQITHISDSVRFFANLGSQNKKLEKFEDGYHELHHDEEQHEMYLKMEEWLGTVNLQPLGVINKRRRVDKRGKGWGRWKVVVVVVVVYVVLVARLVSRKEFKAASAVQKILSPVLYAMQLIRG